MLINNAGVFEANPIDRDDDDWVAELGADDADQPDRVAPNCAGSRCCTGRSAGRGGRIVNVASRAAYRGDRPAHWHYAASKAGHGRR